MLDELLKSGNPLVRFGFAAFIVFAPLYILQSYNVAFAWIIALIILVGVVMPRVSQGASFA